MVILDLEITSCFNDKSVPTLNFPFLILSKIGALLMYFPRIYLATFSESFFTMMKAPRILEAFQKKERVFGSFGSCLKLPAFASGSQLLLQNQTLRVGTYAVVKSERESTRERKEDD